MIILLLSWISHGRGSRSGGVLLAPRQGAYLVVTLSVQQVFQKVDRYSWNVQLVTRNAAQ